jgi:hypothetical protein
MNMSLLLPMSAVGLGFRPFLLKAMYESNKNSSPVFFEKDGAVKLL